MKPLDFSKPRVPVPLPSPPRRRKRRTNLVVVVLVLVLGLVGVGVLIKARANQTNKLAAPGVQAVDPAYCRLSGMLVSLLVGAGIQLDGTVPGSVRGDAMAEVLNQMGGEMDELVSRAPETVRGAAATVVEAVRQAAGGDLSKLQAPAFTLAEQQVARLLQTEACRDPSAGLARGDAP